MTIAVGAIVLGSFLPWASTAVASVRGTDGLGNLTLLLGGTAAALLARWWGFESASRRWLGAGAACCAAAGAVLMIDVARVVQSAARPEGGLFLAMAGALFATMLTSRAVWAMAVTHDPSR